MVTIEQVKMARSMWNSGEPHGIIKDKCNLTYEQEFAITVASDRLSDEDVLGVVNQVTSGMKARQIADLVDTV